MGCAMESPVARNIMLVVAYDGAAYRGWQRQADGVPTVQESLERAIVSVVGHPVHLHGAGRTDAGVHAEGQVANFLTDAAMPADRMRLAINARAPADIVVRRCRDVPLAFHAIGSACGKLYRYTLYHHRDPPPPSLRGRCWHWYRPLEVEPMRQAARCLVGRHDFAAFQSSKGKRASTVRTVGRLEIWRDFRCVHFDVSADGFLYNMVRNLVGTLLEVGRGHWPPGRVAEVLASRQRSQAGRTAPPEGLCLQWVRYDLAGAALDAPATAPPEGS
jgi:tRNA pseudouridine38-40 synthase